MVANCCEFGENEQFVDTKQMHRQSIALYEKGDDGANGRKQNYRKEKLTCIGLRMDGDIMTTQFHMFTVVDVLDVLNVQVRRI